jgi:hypothetical protein
MTRAGVPLRVPARLLGDSDRSAMQALLERHPVTGAQVDELVNATRVDWWRGGARIYGYAPRGHLQAICWYGTNLIPVGVDGDAAPEAVEAFSAIGRSEPRRCSSIVGPAEAVLPMWSRLESSWGPAREVRTDQPLLVADTTPRLAGDPHVRLVRPDELDILLPASIAMYTAEVGVSPVRSDDGQPYRRRVASLIKGRRSYARIEDGEVLFKADLAVVTPRTAQIQGVWVPPKWRGRGLASAGMAAVVTDTLRRGIPQLSLYVNAHNTPARRAYERCGFRQIGHFSTILF